MKALPRNVELAPDLGQSRRTLSPKLLFQGAVFRAKLKTCGDGLFFYDCLELAHEGSAVGFWLRPLRDWIAVLLSFGASLVKFQQAVILGGDRPSRLDPLVSPKCGDPFI